MIKALIVDDEPKAIDLIRSYLSHFSNYQVVDTFRNGLKALEYINTNGVDVVFLDINMPHLSGVSLSKMLPEEIAIVFTTAYSEHAVESYSVNAVDYLLKPINLERFSKTIAKLTTRFNLNTNNSKDEKPSTIFIKSGLETHQLKIDDINYLQKDGNYIYYITTKKKVMARETIGEAMAHLNTDFIQIQKSYIVNFKKIQTLGVDYVIIDEIQIPIGTQFKKALHEKITR